MTYYLADFDHGHVNLAFIMDDMYSNQFGHMGRAIWFDHVGHVIYRNLRMPDRIIKQI